MKKIKKLLTIGLALLLMLCSIVLSGCSDKKYQVSKEEYESAFTVESLQNVTISMTGPYWERDHIKSYFYSVGKNFALCSYSEDTQYYGRYYGIENNEEFCYLYGSERLADFTEEQASWTKCDNPSAYSNKGVNFVLLYRRDFHLLEYNSKTKSYDFEFTAYGEQAVYSYYFTDKKLTKFVITNEADNYEYIWEFYDYGTTVIPVKIDDIETSDKSIISLSSEIESQFDLTDEKIWWNSNTNIDFADDKIIIIFKKTTMYPELLIEDFDYENAESIKYLFLRPTGGQYENAENYRQIAVINLKEKGRDRVIEAVLYFERISIIRCAEPDYIYGIEEDI